MGVFEGCLNKSKRKETIMNIFNNANLPQNAHTARSQQKLRTLVHFGRLHPTIIASHANNSIRGSEFGADLNQALLQNLLTEIDASEEAAMHIMEIWDRNINVFESRMRFWEENLDEILKGFVGQDLQNAFKGSMLSFYKGFLHSTLQQLIEEYVWLSSPEFANNVCNSLLDRIRVVIGEKNAMWERVTALFGENYANLGEFDFGANVYEFPEEPVDHILEFIQRIGEHQDRIQEQLRELLELRRAERIREEMRERAKEELERTEESSLKRFIASKYDDVLIM